MTQARTASHAPLAWLPLPRSFWAWVATASLSGLGVQIVGFAMGWAAAGQGPLLVGLVLTATAVPRTLLLLVGGTAADRSGLWRILLAGDSAMLLSTLLLALLALRWGTSPALLMVAGLVVGTVDAFYLPASGALPRLLLPRDQFARGLALRQIGAQVASTLAGPLAGLIYGAAGLPAAALLNTATFAVMLVLLLHLRRRHPEPPSVPHRTSAGVAVREGILLVATDRLLRTALLLTAAGAALLLPLTPLLLPSLGRDVGWGPQVTGLTVGAVGAAAGLVALVIIVRGASSRPGLTAAAGLGLAGVGAVTVGAGRGSVIPAVLGCVDIGLGTGFFATHMAPLVLGSAPAAFVARVQAIAALAQSLPLVVANVAVGAAAQATSAALVLVAVGGLLIAVSGVACFSGVLRSVGRSV